MNFPYILCEFMQKRSILITNIRIFTFPNVSFSALDSANFLGFGCKKIKKCILFSEFQKTKSMEPSKI